MYLNAFVLDNTSCIRQLANKYHASFQIMPESFICIGSWNADREPPSHNICEIRIWKPPSSQSDIIKQGKQMGSTQRINMV